MRQDKLLQISRTIRPGQRLATKPEQNFARREVTNCVKPEGWRMIGHNASEGIEPRNVHRRIGPRVSCPGSQQRDVRQGECGTPCRGLSPWQVIQRSASELGRAMPFPTEASNEAGEVRRRYDGRAVGPARSRGVVGVMPGAGRRPTRRGWQSSAEG